MRGKSAKKLTVCLAVLLLLLTACSSRGQVMDGEDMVRSDTEISQDETKEMPDSDISQESEPEAQVTEEEKTDMKLKIGE